MLPYHTAAATLVPSDLCGKSSGRVVRRRGPVFPAHGAAAFDATPFSRPTALRRRRGPVFSVAAASTRPRSFDRGTAASTRPRFG